MPIAHIGDEGTVLADSVFYINSGTGGDFYTIDNRSLTDATPWNVGFEGYTDRFYSRFGSLDSYTLLAANSVGFSTNFYQKQGATNLVDLVDLIPCDIHLCNPR